MAVAITSVALVGGNPPTQVQIVGTYGACEKIDVWISCNHAKPGRPLISYNGASPFTIDVALPKTCSCGDIVWVWVDCHQSLGAPSQAAASTSLTFDCDCCPNVSIAAPVVSYAGGVATASFALTSAVTWSPMGCTPTVTITGYQWTVKQGATRYQLTTSTATASTDSGNWTTGNPATPATLPLALAAGAWDVNVQLVFSAALSTVCTTYDNTPFQVTPPQCCPFERKLAPHGVTVSAVATGAAPTATATFTAALHWPKVCPVVTPTKYLWEVTDPSGSSKYSRDTTTNITYSNDPGANWTLNGVQIGALPFNTGGAYLVVCTAVFPAGSTADGCPAFGSATFPVAGMQPAPPPSCCPAVTAGASIAGATGSFSATIAWPGGCASTAPASFAWTVTDKSTNTIFVKTTTASSTDQTGFTPPLTLTAGHTYEVSVKPAFPGIVLPQGCDVTGKTTVSAPGGSSPPPPTSSSSPVCIFLLVAAIVLLLLGGIVLVLGICLSVVWVWIVGAAIGATGLGLFIAWAIFCAKMTPCSLMVTMECILDWIVKTGWIAAVVVAIIGLLGFGGLPCAIAAISVWSGWGVLDSFLRTIMFRVGCPPIDCTKSH
jgi:hypothetical protein